MKKEIRYELSNSENEIMKYLWENQVNKGKSFGEIMYYLNNDIQKNWKKQTVNTLLKRMIDKGLVMINQDFKNKLYVASVTQLEYERGKARAFLNEFYKGSVTGFISALTGGEKLDKKTADELRKMLG